MCRLKSCLLSILLFLFFALHSFFHAPDSQASEEMICKVSQPTPEECTPYPVLEKGELTIIEESHFKLYGRYTACYHSEEVAIKGRVKRFSYHDGMDLELLATEIQLSPTIIQRFPRTIGTVTLEKGPLKGYFFDTWATIRTRGIFRHDPFSRVIHCTKNEEY